MRLRLLLLAVGLLTIWPLVSTADAHANLVAASPAAGQAAGGTIARVEMVFDEPITELVAGIEAPDGSPVAIDLVPVTKQQFDLVFEPLEVEGIYRVRYEFLSLDADRVELGHVFEFDRSAPAPLPFSGPVPTAATSRSWPQWAAVAVVAIVVLGLAARLVQRRRVLARVVG